MDDQNRVQEALRQATATQIVAGDEPDEALSRLTEALRAGLPGSGQGPDLLTAQLPADADPFEFFGSGKTRLQVEAPLPWLSPSGGAGIVERRVALMAQDMAAFGGLGREAPLRLDPPAEVFRHEYFA